MPRRISSCTLVSSRQTTAARSSPCERRSSCRVDGEPVAATRRTPGCGGRRPVRRTVRSRSPGLRGGNPSKQNLSVGSPETASAVVTADGPGIAVTRDPGRRGRGDEPVAGVADAGHPGVGDDEHVLALSQLVDQLRGAACLDHVVVRHHPAGDPHVQRRRRAGAPGGCPRRRSRRRSASSAASRAEASSGRPMGTAAERQDSGTPCRGPVLTCRSAPRDSFRRRRSTPHPGFPPHTDDVR